MHVRGLSWLRELVNWGRRRPNLKHLLVSHFDVFFEATECDEDDGEIVERADFGAEVKDFICHNPTDSMN